MRGVSYSQWLEYVNGAGAKGFKSQEFSSLQECYPSIGEKAQYGILEKELAKLETVLLKKSISGFQMSVNHCLEESDLEILAWGIKEFKRNVSSCYFFHAIEGYPLIVRKHLCSQIGENLAAFVDEYRIFLKKLSENDSCPFIEDFAYICKKAKLRKFIEEFNVYG